MKIGNPKDAVVGGISPRAEGATATRAQGKSSLERSSSESAKVTLSSAAAGLTVHQPGEFDAEKVARVRQAISDGTYRINAEAIADKLIANAKELTQARMN